MSLGEGDAFGLGDNLVDNDRSPDRRKGGRLMDTAREFLRHTLATLAYRGGKIIKDVPDDFATFRAGNGVRTPIELLAHLGDLVEWSSNMAQGNPAWNPAAPSTWSEDSERFFSALKHFDEYLGSDGAIGAPIERLFQGPLADALTHLGQLVMLRRIAGAPMRSENYYKASVETGRVGPDQNAPQYEFD
ncbi:MAG: hypothetical protein DMF61_13400 [Blastocatellia bacterium AA13]|nr:MAG: hypothetical protein DMF61_13400 [Blastocatellia bacterium AA13]